MIYDGYDQMYLCRYQYDHLRYHTAEQGARIRPQDVQAILWNGISSENKLLNLVIDAFFR